MGPRELRLKHVDEIVLVRHGETDRNTARRIGKFIATSEELHKMGILPDYLVPLNLRGRRQAACLGQIIKKRHPSCLESNIFFDSGYLRTIETLDVILSTWGQESARNPVRESHLELREREGGYPFNMSVTELCRYFPWYLEYASIVGPFFERRPGGESIADVCLRVHMFLNSLRRKRKGQKVFIVTHGGVMLAFRFWLERWSLDKSDGLFTKGNESRNCNVLIYKRDRDLDESDDAVKFRRHTDETEINRDLETVLREEEERREAEASTGHAKKTEKPT